VNDNTKLQKKRHAKMKVSVTKIQGVQHKRKVAWNKFEVYQRQKMKELSKKWHKAAPDDSEPAANKPKWRIDQTDAEREEEKANWQRRVLTPRQRRLEEPDALNCNTDDIGQTVPIKQEQKEEHTHTPAKC
jgi:hypothetical protein